MIALSPILAALLLSTQGTTETQNAAQDAAEPVAQTVAAAADPEEAGEDEKMICRRTAVIGSKFKKRICATKKEWETLREQNVENAREMQRRGKGLDPNGQ